MNLRILLLNLIITLMPIFAIWADSWNVELKDFYNPANTWAYKVHVDGGWVYVVCEKGLRVIKVHNGSLDKDREGFCLTSYTHEPQGIYVHGNYAYIACGTDGLCVIDVSDPYSPYEVVLYSTPGEANGVYVRNVASEDYAYVADGSMGLRVIDMSNHSSPREEGFYDTLGDAQGVYVDSVASYAYVADGSEGLRVIDVSNRSSPWEVGFYDPPDDAQGVDVANVAGMDYAFVTDGSDGLRVIDIRYRADPLEMELYDTPGSAQEVDVDNLVGVDYAFVADGSSGLRIIDISDPKNLLEVGFYETLGDAQGVYCDGKYVYIADGNKGLCILRPIQYVPLEARISASSPTTVGLPLTVTFTDSSLGWPTSWSWDFGDGETSDSEGPLTHTYTQAGSYTVSLTVTDPVSSDIATKTINVVTRKPSVDITSEHGSWESGVVTIEAEATDEDGSIQQVVFEYKPSGGEWHRIDTDTTSPYSVSWDTTSAIQTANSRVRVRATATDNDGATDDDDTTFGIDNESPTTSHGYNGQWHKRNFTIVLTGDDNSGSGIAAVYYTINGGARKSVFRDGYPEIDTEGDDNKLEYWSVDNAGNEETRSELSGIKLDETPPITGISLSGDEGGNGWYKSSLQIALSATDSLSGADSIKYRIDSGNWQDYSSKFAIHTDGEHTIEYYSTDNAGNQENTKSETLKVDTAAPDTTIFLSGRKGKNGWYLTEVGIRVSANDNQSGIDFTKYKTDDGNWQNYHSAFTIYDDGEHVIEYCSVDAAGNAEETKAEQIKIDTIAPDASLALSGSELENGWYISDVIVDIDSSDSGSGVESEHIRVGSGSWQTPPVTIAAENIQTVEFYAKDSAGNESSKRSAQVKVDKSLSSPPQISSSTHRENVWSNSSSPELSWKEPLDTSGISGYSYELDRDPSTIPDETIDGNSTSRSYKGLDDAEDWYFHVRAKDKAGWWGETAHFGPIKIDVVPPESSISLPESKGKNGWYISPIAIALLSTDSLSGVKFTKYRVNGGNWYNYSVPIKIDGELSLSEYTIEYYSQDNAGNEDMVTTSVINMDGTPPTSCINLSGTRGNSDWYVSSVVVILSVEDTASGADATGYRINGGDWQEVTYTGTPLQFTMYEDGEHTIEYYSEDRAGNRENIRSDIVRIDTTPPITRSVISDEKSVMSIQNPERGWYVSPVEVELSAEDATSGIGVTEYRINNGNWQGKTYFASTDNVTTTTVITIDTDGEYAIEYRSKDKAGNQETAKTESIRLDTTPPTTAFDISSGTPGENDWYTSPVEIRLSVEKKDTSGVDVIQYRIDGDDEDSTPVVEWENYSKPIEISKDGEYTIEYYSKDVAGNQEDTKSEIVKIDTEPPTTRLVISGEKSAMSIQNPESSIEYQEYGWYVSSVEVTFSVEDEASGMDITRYQLDENNEQEFKAYLAPTLITIDTDGEHIIRYYSKDRAGNQENVKSAVVKIDSYPPGELIVSSSTHEKDKWSNISSPGFSWTEPTDISGISGYSYVLDKEPSTVPDEEYEGSSVSKSYTDAPDGEWYFHVRAQDNAGQWGETAHYGRIMIDTQAPKFSQWAYEPDILAVDTKGSLIVKLEITDALSGVSGAPQLDYRIDGDYSGREDMSLALDDPRGELWIFQIKEDWSELSGKTVYYKVAATDEAGNSIESEERYVQIESAPRIKIITWFPEWVSGEQKLEVDVEDDDNNLGKVLYSYSLDNIQWVEIGETAEPRYTIDWDTSDIVCDGSVWVRAIAEDTTVGADGAMPLRGEDISESFGVDNKPPTTQHDYDGKWHKPPFIITLAGDDGEGIGVSKTRHKLSEFLVIDDPRGDDEQSGALVWIYAEGIHEVEYWSIDQLGNEEPHKTLSEVKIDATPPQTTITLSGTKGYEKWYVSTVQVILSAEDPLSGVNVIKYRLNNSAPQEYSEPIIVDSDGECVVQFWCIDKAGNQEEARSESFGIDTQPPTAAILKFGSEGENDWYVSDVTVDCDASDAASGIVERRIKVDNGSWQTPPITISDEGKHEVTFYAADQVGNKSEEQSEEIKLDKTPPEIANYTHTPAALSEETEGDLTITVTIRDTISGIPNPPQLTYKIAGGYTSYENMSPSGSAGTVPASDSDWIFKIQEDWRTLGGETAAYKVRAYDGAGNQVESENILVGQIQQARISVPDSISLGAVRVNEPVEKELTIRNVGSVLLEVTNISTDVKDITVFETELTIQPGGEHSIPLIFRPSNVCKLEGRTLTIESNDPNSPATVRLNGYSYRDEAQIVLLGPDSVVYRSSDVKIGIRLSMEEDSSELARKQELTITYTKPSGQEIGQEASPSEKGSNTHTAVLDADKIDEVGEWIAVVHWDGNDEYLSADGHTLFRVTKAPSEVCWSLPAKTVPVDKPVLLTGALVPAISGDASILQEDGTVDSANIEGEPTTFRLTDPDGTVEEFPVETETGGKFQKKYTFDSAGDWTLEIFWGGNDIYRGCDGKTVVNVYIEPPKAIVILGGDKDDPDFDTFNTIANEVYRALRKRGFADEDIYYLNPREQQVEQATREIPLLYDGESIHVDNITSKQELEYAITDWAAEYVGPHTPLLIYLLSHNTGDSFLLERSSNAKLHLLPDELDDWISELENTLLTTYEQVPAQDAERLPVAQAPGSADVPPESLPVSSITIFIDACNSGSFLEPLAEEVKNSKDEVVVNRTVITSTDVGEPAYISTADSFSSSFFKCFCTYDVKSAFEEASNIIAEYSKQKPLLDSNGNGVPNEPADYAGVEGLEISGTSRIAATLPTIESVSFEPSQLEQGDSAAISVKLSVLALGDPREQDAESLSVSGVLIPPSYNRDRQLEQWSELESGLINITFQKKDDDANVGPEGIYESNAHEFTECGKYVLIVHADSRNGDAVPYKTQIEVERIQVVEPTNEQTTQPEIVENTMLHQNYPNPFIPDTWVPYQLKDDADVVIKIYTVTGQLVRTLNPGHKPAGFYTAKDRAAYWDGKNEAGEHVASGIYFYAIQAGDFTDTKKMVAVK